MARPWNTQRLSGAASDTFRIWRDAGVKGLAIVTMDLFTAQRSDHMKKKLLLGCAVGLLVALTRASSATLYVDAASTNAVPPFTNWATAAANIQDAVDAAAPGDEIVVTNGVYQTGARDVYGMSNRVAVTKPVTVRSVNGPEATIIKGSGAISPAAIRCVYLTNGAVLAGFTLTNGATQFSGNIHTNQSGGGLWCEGPSVIVSNCVLTGNAAQVGGGVFGGTLNNCVVAGNYAWDDDGGGGAYASKLDDCVVKGNGAYYRGGGAAKSTLNNCMVTGNEARYENGGGALLCNLTNCTVTGNSATYGGGALGGALDNCIISGNSVGGEGAIGGGAAYSLLNNCIIMGNSGGYAGGGAFGSTLNNCKLTGNSAGAGGGTFAGTLNNCTLTGNSAGSGGGVFAGTLNNCLVYFNESANGPNWGQSDFYPITFNYSCTTPDPGSGIENITDAPLFVDTNGWSNLRLQSNSPCINAGNNAFAMGVIDLDSQPRISGGAVDIGAFEWQGATFARPGTIRYVSAASTNPIAPYRSWEFAAVTIQDAVDAAAPGDKIVVTNGVYQTGAREGNRVAVTKPVTVRSVNGPGATSIVGSGPTGPTAVRCVYLTNGATLAGFTLTNGAAQIDGGGVLCAGPGAVVSNCVFTANSAGAGGGGASGGTLNNCTFTRNSAAEDGGGAHLSILNNCTLTSNSAGLSGGAAFVSTLNNCTVTGNTASTGGGADSCTLNNCTLTGNSANYGGGVYISSLNNCIVYYNRANTVGDNYYFSSFNYSCTTPGGGVGNITNAPLFLDTNGWSNLRLQSNSPGINAGNNAYVAGSTDLDGRPRIAGGVVDIGAFEWQGTTRYVSAASTNPIAPYSSWEIAAVTIQDAVDAAAPGDTVLVTNGVYAAGGRPASGMNLNNRVCVDRAITLRSVNGPGSTVIHGMGNARCAYLTNGAVLTGFTLTNGVTQGEEGLYQDQCGGGVWCKSASAVVSNCTLAGNSAYYHGGGAFDGTLNNCVLTGNIALEAFGGGAVQSTLNNCTLTDNQAFLGGGAHNSTLTNCTITGNSAWERGGGAFNSMLFNCSLTGNRAFDYGGGAFDSTLFNCALTGNWALTHGGGASLGTLTNCTITENLAEFGGGASYCALYNCVVYHNSSSENIDRNHYASTFNYSCTTPDPGSGVGNITNAPLFVDTNGWSNLRLQSNSPGINAGNNAYVATSTDLDGRPRLVGGVVDMGAYEYQGPGTGEFFGWLQQSGLPTDGSADAVDTDHDGHNNWQEWMAGTNPTNALSALRLASPVLTPTNVTLTWTSVTNRTYTLEQATNVGGGPVFSVLRSNLPGLPGTTSWTDTNAPVSSPRFYQLRVSP